MRNHLYTCDANGHNMEPLAPAESIEEAREIILDQYGKIDEAKIVNERIDEVGGTVFEVEANNDNYDRVMDYYCKTI